MKPLRLEMTNFGSHRSTTIDFAPLNLAVLSGQNGAGKSTIIDAIRFALWGTTRSGLDDAIMRGEEVCRVAMDFALDGTVYTVTRQRSRKGNGSSVLTFASGGKTLGGAKITETQARISSLLHMTDDLFARTACAGQGDSALFTKARPGERKDVLASILDLDKWEVYAKAARVELATTKAEREAAQGRLEEAERVAEGLPTIVGELLNNTTLQERHRATVLAEKAVLDGVTEGREKAVTARAEDEGKAVATAGQRNRLAEAQARHEVAAWDHAEAKEGDRPEHLEEARSAVAEAEAAQESLATFQAAKDTRTDLWTRLSGHEAKAQNARAKHAQEVSKLAVEVRRLQDAEKARQAQAEQRMELLNGQAGLLDLASCANEAARSLLAASFVDACPLLAAARQAATQIPALAQEMAALDPVPWATIEAELKALQEQEPWAEDSAAAGKLTQEWAGITYDEDAHRTAQKLAALLPARRKALDELTSLGAVLSQRQQAVEAAAEEVARETTALEALPKPSGTDWAAQIADLDRRANQARANVTSHQESLQILVKEAGALEERQAAAGAAVELAKAIRATVEGHEQRETLLNLLGNPRHGAFSKAGIPALLIEQAVPALEDHSNEILGILSDHTLVVRLVSQKETDSGVSETLDVQVLQDGESRLYETYSGGEAMRVDLALRIGLSMLLASRAGARCELLALDESASPLDQRGIDAFVEALQRIADRFSVVLCVSHLEALKDRFPARLEVTKGPEGSVVEVVTA